MNRLFVAMVMAGSFALLLGSCKKDNTTVSVNAGLPQLEEELDGRAYVDITANNAIKWNANDQIVIFNLDNTNGTSERGIYQTDANAEGKTTAHFDYASGDQLGAKKNGYFVFYPTDKVDNVALGVDNYQSFTVSPTQTYTLSPSNNPTVDPAGMATACTLNDLGGSFNLKHIFGVLKLRLKGTGNVTSIVVEDKRFNLSGTVSMKLHAVDMDRFTTLQNYFIGTNDPDNNPTFMNAWNSYKTDLNYSAQGTGKTITLNCPNVALNTSTETLFFIGLRPGALKYGYKIYVYTEGASQPVVFENDGSWNYGIKAGIIKNLALSF